MSSSSSTNNKNAKKATGTSSTSSPSSSLPASKLKTASSPLNAGKKKEEDKTTTASSSSTSPQKLKKSVKIADEGSNTTTVFNKNNPVTHMTSFVDVDWEKEEQEEKQRLLQHRAKHNAIDPKEVTQNHPTQAFHIAQIPYVIDTATLTVTELKEELHARNLPTKGIRTHLVKRLEAFLKEFEGHRLEKAVQDEEKIIQQQHDTKKKK